MNCPKDRWGSESANRRRKLGGDSHPSAACKPNGQLMRFVSQGNSKHSLLQGLRWLSSLTALLQQLFS